LGQAGANSQRSGAVVEPRISTQWFVKMKELAGPALSAVLDGEVTIHPGEKFLATYKYWLENVKDWCISRQLWWGQQIPAWYTPDGTCIVAEHKNDAFEIYKKKGGASADELKQDEDVLDTWFSSWLWPIQVFKGITNPGNEELKYYYPTSVLVTGQDIIFFWVARMVMAGMHFENRRPFEHVYFTGMVRDKLGRKMSKSLGNSPDLLELIDKYSADAVRFGILIASPAGNDLLFDEAALEQGRNFNNKLWNALKLVKMWEGRVENDLNNGEENFAVQWFEQRLNYVKFELDEMFVQFRLSEALKTIYSLVWDDFCSWYLEWVKPAFGQAIDGRILNKTIGFFTELLHLLHPFMPFISEEIYHLLQQRDLDLCVRQYISVQMSEGSLLKQGELLKAAISGIRDTRNKSQIKPKDEIKLFIETQSPDNFLSILPILGKQVNASAVEFTNQAPAQTITTVIGMDKFYIDSEIPVDSAAQKDDMAKELEYLRGFLLSVEKKLSNDRFIQNAKPEVVELEKRKKADAEIKIRTLEESLSNLS